MLTLPPTVRVFVASAPVDLRKGFDGLSALVQSSFGHDPTSIGAVSKCAFCSLIETVTA